jgi:hypothetical protein
VPSTRHSGSGGEPGAAFLTAASDNITSGCSCHTGEETEPAFTAAVRGLKSSFHFRFILFFLLFSLKINSAAETQICGHYTTNKLVDQLK